MIYKKINFSYTRVFYKLKFSCRHRRSHLFWPWSSLMRPLTSRWPSSKPPPGCKVPGNSRYIMTDSTWLIIYEYLVDTCTTTTAITVTAATAATYCCYYHFRYLGSFIYLCNIMEVFCVCSVYVSAFIEHVHNFVVLYSFCSSLESLYKCADDLTSNTVAIPKIL